MTAAAADHQARRVRLAVPPVTAELQHFDAGQMRHGAGQPRPGQRVAKVCGQCLVLTPMRSSHLPMMRLERVASASPRPRTGANSVCGVEPPAVAQARRLADELLRPNAELVDAAGVPRSHLDALAAAGLMDMTELPGPVAREVAELLAAADASTWFVWTQHHSPVRTVARGTNAALRAEWLPRLRSGERLAGVAFTHLRRPGPPQVAAARRGDGWQIDGDIAWLTSWGLADVFLIGAQAGDDVVWVLTALTGRPEVTSEPLQLAAMNGTSTVRVRVSGLVVASDEVALVEPLADWRAVDAAKSADVSAAVFGVITEVGRRLRERNEAAATDFADAVQHEADQLRRAAYALIDGVEAGERLEERLHLRASAHALACRATQGLVAAGAGRSMLLDSAAQRLARVALFLQVQGQTAAVREATLRVLAAATGARPDAAG